MKPFASHGIYHLFPLGTCGTNGIRSLIDWIPAAQTLGCDTVLFGPCFDSQSHGYDTRDYRKPDSRLGTQQDFLDTFAAWKKAGFRILLDAALNHCGREFAPFQDVLRHGIQSPYRHWFAHLDFNQSSPMGDSFTYTPWSGCYDLVKYNHQNPELKAYLFDIVGYWMDTYEIDGLRLDAADVIPMEFLSELSDYCKNRNPNFWLMGEVVHGDYRKWVQDGKLDSVTNYELHKGLWSSCNDHNLFEIAWGAQRQFGSEGLYSSYSLGLFLDNHDVNRIGSQLDDIGHLWPLWILTYTLPGIPIHYYGSEVGWLGKRSATSDKDLRPAMHAQDLQHGPQPELISHIQKLSHIRKEQIALHSTKYQQILVESETMAFIRSHNDSILISIIHIGTIACEKSIPIPSSVAPNGTKWIDLLSGDIFTQNSDQLQVQLNPNYGRILVPRA